MGSVLGVNANVNNAINSTINTVAQTLNQDIGNDAQLSCKASQNTITVKNVQCKDISVVMQICEYKGTLASKASLQSVSNIFAKQIEKASNTTSMPTSITIGGVDVNVNNGITDLQNTVTNAITTKCANADSFYSVSSQNNITLDGVTCDNLKILTQKCDAKIACALQTISDAKASSTSDQGLTGGNSNGLSETAIIVVCGVVGLLAIVAAVAYRHYSTHKKAVSTEDGTDGPGTPQKPGDIEMTQVQPASSRMSRLSAAASSAARSASAAARGSSAAAGAGAGAAAGASRSAASRSAASRASAAGATPAAAAPAAAAPAAATPKGRQSPGMMIPGVATEFSIV
jgi:hypothetical protein